MQSMPYEYDEITAFHYASYRPSLHLTILEESLEKGRNYGLGLDVGCGTGQSSIALAGFCNEVQGIDPSKEMLDKSIEHARITYSYFNKKHFGFSDNYFDLVTFAGSLFYAKSQIVLDEVIRVSKIGAMVIVYDFELLLDPILSELNGRSISKKPIQYNHETNFEGLNEEHITLKKKLKKRVLIEISNTNLSHLLLSSKDNYELISNALGNENLYAKVCEKLQSIFNTNNIRAEACTYSSSYQILK